eukprot:4194499-Amphidinium_carterae.1
MSKIVSTNSSCLSFVRRRLNGIFVQNFLLWTLPRRCRHGPHGITRSVARGCHKLTLTGAAQQSEDIRGLEQTSCCVRRSRCVN